MEVLNMGRKKKQFWYEALGTCPHCKKPNYIKVEREVVKPSEKAEIKYKLSIDKAEQQVLIPAKR
jgi:hypothetical protein